MCGGFHRAQKMRHLLVSIGMSIKVQKDRFLTVGEFCIGSRNGLNDAPGDRVIPANGYRPCARCIDVAIKVRDPFDTGFVIVCFRQRNISKVMDAVGSPGINVELHMDPLRHS